MKFKAIFVCLLLVCQQSLAGVDFDGVDDVVDISSNFGVDVQGVGAIVCHVYIQDNLESGAFMQIGEAPNVCAGDKGISIGVGSNDFDTDGNEMLYLKSCVAWCDGNDAIGTGWRTVGFNWNGTFVEGFADGVSGGVVGCSTAVAPGNDAAIGGLDSGYRNFDGIVSWCAVWNTTLSAEEHAYLASGKTKNLPLQIKPANLKAFYPIDQCSDGVSCDGQRFNDASSTAATGTGNNGANNTGLTGSAEASHSYT